jgi:imidazolonepropionase-like amidohydrolase
MQAAATGVAADCLGPESEIGTLEAGKYGSPGGER